MTWTLIPFVPKDAMHAYLSAGSPATWTGTVHNRQWHIAKSSTGLQQYRWDVATSVGRPLYDEGPAQPSADQYNIDYTPPLNGQVIQSPYDGTPPHTFPGKQTTDSGLSGRMREWSVARMNGGGGVGGLYDRNNANKRSWKGGGTMSDPRGDLGLDSGQWVECGCEPETLGATPQMFRGSWHAKSGTKTMRWAGIGAHALLQGNRTEVSAANMVLAYFDNNPCTKASIPVVSDFQRAYNASGLPGSLTVDGQYGPNTQQALQNVIDMAEAGIGPTQAAPPNCWGTAVPAMPAPDAGQVVVTPPASPTTTTVTTNVNPPPSTSWTPWVIGGAAVAGAGVVGYAYWKKHHRGR